MCWIKFSPMYFWDAPSSFKPKVLQQVAFYINIKCFYSTTQYISIII